MPKIADDRSSAPARRDAAGVERASPVDHETEAPSDAANERHIARLVPVRVADGPSTPTARHVAAIGRQADRLRGECVRLRAQATTLGTAPCAAHPPSYEALVEEPILRLEVLRRAILSVRARIRTLEARAQASTPPPAAVAKLAALRQEVLQLWETLRQVLREDIPPEPD
jgi:hypothetical protein